MVIAGGLLSIILSSSMSLFYPGIAWIHFISATTWTTRFRVITMGFIIIPAILVLMVQLAAKSFQKSLINLQKGRERMKAENKIDRLFQIVEYRNELTKILCFYFLITY